MKKKAPKFYSVEYYIEEVVKYRTEHGADQGAGDGYPPVVPELLLSMYFRIRTITFTLGAICGLLVALLFRMG